ncbi:bifunctional protein-disulfide isomerase/oxidoreductase DsbC [Pseudoalteromonas sp. SSM20]|uniref:bifunctional protein-disulfide isomerase/oxidoreductase DsbC n=1 Tax=Pseudoalteromonas sp. SSM20 TaxID=3139394 RepID=UPI003BA88B2A
MKKLAIAAALLSAAFNISANGVAAASVDPIETKIIAEFEKIGLKASGVAETPVKGLYEVLTNRGVLYSTADGKYLLQGTLLDLENKENLTEVALGNLRKEGVKQFADSMIVYPAKNEKYKVTIFTDITCGYCRKLHRELEDYLDAGITVQYLAYPRAGIPSKGFDDLQDIWCAKDAAKALTDAKAGEDVVDVAACNAPVKEQFEMGQSFGITGTPAIILEDGTLIPGYQPAAQLKQILESSTKG